MLDELAVMPDPLAAFRAGRADTIAMLAKASDADWARTANFAE